MYLSTKMLLYNLLAKGIILLFFLMTGPFLLRYFALEDIDAELEDKRDQILDIISQDGMDEFFAGDDSPGGFGSYNILREEYVLLEKMEEPFLLDSIFNEERILDNVTVSYRVCAYVFSFEEEIYLMEIGKSLETINRIIDLISGIILSLLLAFLATSFFLDNFFSKRLIQPFKKIIRDKISHINEPQQFMHEPVKTSTRDFKMLDEAISDMMWRIQKAFNQERVFISHASHELRTPVSILQTKIEAFFGDENLDPREMERLMDMQETIQKLKKIINALLLLSKVNNAQFLKTETVSLDGLLEALFEEWQALAKGRSLDLHLEIRDKFAFRQSNASLCHIMVQNALSNALKYAYENTSIQMIGKREPAEYQIHVINEGPEISEELMEQVAAGLVFLKDAKKESSGFGLQIIFKIAGFLGVKVRVESNNTSGTRFIFCFPIN
ncbi:HAMP domain-containing sensor histidine kinase [Cyclobacterium sp.]|uniref:sensor histidine kinase n=1 Tax=Cyclobacterium sp. TaxID=1966343 RepID=UPI00199EDF52|nr:HAMP domain-containing sensor histidine kinase [Cyclobacterium sp.]MBD3630665.1 HAMP domain-containing histidine kinase [Cyclobacterium sp.]